MLIKNDVMIFHFKSQAKQIQTRGKLCRLCMGAENAHSVVTHH